MRSNWSKRKVKELCTLIVDCVNKTAPKEVGPTPFKMIRTTNIKGGRLDTDNCNFVSEETFIKWTRRAKLEPKDILLTREAPIGEAAQVKCGTGLFLGQRIMQYRPNPREVDPDYLFFTFLSPILKEQFGMHEGSGSTVSHIRVGDCSEFDIPCPTIEEQRRVSAVLRALFDYEEILSEQNTTLEALAQTLFRSWFVNFDPVHAKAAGQTPEGMSPELAALFPSEFVESELGMIPKGWSVATVGSEFNLTMGQSPPGSSYNELGQGTLFFQGRTDFGFRFPSNRTYTTEPSRYAKSGNVLLSVRAPVGDINVALDDCCIGRGLAALSSKHDWHSYCLYAIKNLAIAFESFDKEGTIFGSINKADLSAMTLVGPDAALQQQFNKIAAPIDAQITVNEQMIRTFSTIRDELLPRLVSGKLRIEEAEEAVSEVLGSTADEEKAA